MIRLIWACSVRYSAASSDRTSLYCSLKDANHSACDELSASEMKNILELFTGLVGPRGSCSYVRHCATAGRMA